MSELSILSIGGGKPNGKAAPLLRRALELTSVEKSPRVLSIATAKTTRESHEAAIANTRELFQDQLGLPFESLHDFNTMGATEEIEEKLEAADLVYIAGGDTLRMMDVWREYGIQRIIARRAFEGLVISGISAGAIAPFTWGHSDSESYRVGEGSAWDFIKVDGLGLINAAVTPHYNTQPQGNPRSDSFAEMFKGDTGPTYGVGIDNLAAIEVSGGSISVVSRKAGAGVTILERRGEDITATKFEDGSELKIPV